MSNDTVAKVVAPVLAAVATPDLEAAVAAALKKLHAEKVEAARPQEPDWANLTEQDAYKASIYIPTIEHDIPDYMNMKLKDTEYEVVWASKDSRRIGQLLAEGYEYLKKEHVHPSFKIPLPFGSDGHYEYVDVVCMRVHKRILYGKRRRGFEVTQQQLGRAHKMPAMRGASENLTENTFRLAEPPNPMFGDLYVPDAV
jgi:hypothetical protein